MPIFGGGMGWIGPVLSGVGSIMGSKNQPQGVDPWEAAVARAKTRQIGQDTPWHNVRYVGEHGSPDRRQVVTLDPTDQARLDNRRRLSAALMGSSSLANYDTAFAEKQAQQAEVDKAVKQWREEGSPDKWTYNDSGFDVGAGDAGYTGINTGYDFLGAGGLMDMIDNATGGALSGFHNAGVDEFGGLAAGGTGGIGWDPGGQFGGGAEGAGDFGDIGDLGGWDDAGGFDAWQKGGYTGAGKDMMVQPSMPAGTVHEGEFVMSAPAVQNLGVQNLQRLHNAAKGKHAGLAAAMAGGGAKRPPMQKQLMLGP